MNPTDPDSPPKNCAIPLPPSQNDLPPPPPPPPSPLTDFSKLPPIEVSINPPDEDPRPISGRGHLPFRWAFRHALILIFFGILVFGGARALNLWVFESYYVDGTSMTPTLQDNDRLLIGKLAITGARLTGQEFIPSRGQIVVVDSAVSPITAHNQEPLIKRVIGLPGDTLSFHDGEVIVSNSTDPNGFDADSLLGLTLEPTYVESPTSVTVPAGHVFVMGDNRAQGGSYDSREFGAVPEKYLTGVLGLRILPLTQIRLF